MTESKPTGAVEETRPVPSQSEGDDPARPGQGDRPVPSQAEGDEETIDKSLRDKETQS